MGKAPPNMALVCVPSTSVTKSQSVFPVSAEPSLRTLNTPLPSVSSPAETTSSRRVKKISPAPKIPRKYSIEK